MNINEETTITNRIALGIEGALTTFIIGSIIWLCFNWFFFTGNQTIYAPFSIVWFFTFPSFIFCALTLENHLLELLLQRWESFGKAVNKLNNSIREKIHTRQSF